MAAYLTYLQDRLRSSFWLVPGLMALAAILAAVLMLAIDRLPSTGRLNLWMPMAVSVTQGAEGARLVLSTIAGSMVTAASLVFSLTLVALTLAAGNIGPRLLDRIMDNRINQVALGLFLSTFVYSLIILRSVTSGERGFVPHLSVSLAMVMAIASFLWLIVFIHDLARSIQVDKLVAEVADELAESFRVQAHQDRPAFLVDDDEPLPGTPIPAGASGYIQAIDTGLLLKLAVASDTVIKLRRRAGHFVIPPTVLADVAGPLDADFAAKLRKAIVLGPKRTAVQDNEFRIDLIVEIAARALSPGVNDFYTALACVDHLAKALDAAIEHGLPGNGYRDDAGRPRLMLVPVTIDALMDAAFHPLRQTAVDSVPVLLRLLECLAMLAEGRAGHDVLSALRRHGDLIHQAALSREPGDHDRRALQDRYATLLALLDERTLP